MTAYGIATGLQFPSGAQMFLSSTASNQLWGSAQSVQWVLVAFPLGSQWPEW
jgi:hypothetical protein